MPAPRLNSLTIQGLRSVGPAGVTIDLPESGPLVLLGENNAGKSNITSALEILFGERYPSKYQPEDHDFFGRDSDGVTIALGARVANLGCDKCDHGELNFIRLVVDPSSESPVDFSRSSSCYHTYMSSALREQLFCMLIGADRRLSYQLSYASKYTYPSRVMHRFHTKLLARQDRVVRLKGIFQDILSEFSEVAEFQEFRRLLSSSAEDFGQNLAYRLDMDFSAYDPSNFFRSLRVHPQLDGEARSFDELGSGQEQILALAFSYAYAKAFSGSSGLILTIDEPESHLHPVAQKWLANRLNSLVTDGLQVVITTHSPQFVDLARPENLVVVRRASRSASTSITEPFRVTIPDSA